MTPSLPPLSLSILGVEPLDEFIKEIADFIHHMINIRPEGPGHVEVEAKIGVLVEKTSGQRLVLPVLVETRVLAPGNEVGYRFESNMSLAHHAHYNALLNKLGSSSTQPDHPTSPIQYTHKYLIDSFYPVENSRDRDKIRITRDEKTGAVIECMQKVRLGDLNVYSPKRPLDWRVSVNLEVPAQHPLGSATHTRKKNRMCYSHEEFNIDLTQVKSQNSPGAPAELSHELEIEIARSDLLLATAAKRGDMNCPEHERDAFDELIRAFVNNARILVRNSP